ncbi:MAG: YggS family pyridoxal phosphate-dependent enzyme [bacterium]|jgi:hypothetical protein
MASVIASGDRVIADNFARVRERIERAAHGRDVTLVCVTKYVGEREAAALVRAGATDLGENRVFEGAEKFAAIKREGLAFTSHMIGPVQSNKAKRIPYAFDWCQSLSREKIARLIQEACKEHETSLDATIEVNIGREEQKDGVMPESLGSLVKFVLYECPLVRLRGLMCIPPLATEDATRDYFAQTRNLFDKIGAEFRSSLPAWDTLSMGMSADFEAAIEEGSTMVRIGSELYRGLQGFMH